MGEFEPVQKEEKESGFNFLFFSKMSYVVPNCGTQMTELIMDIGETGKHKNGTRIGSLL